MSRNAALTFLAAAFLAACGTSSPGTTAAGSSPMASPTPVSCRTQYDAWKHGPARTAALKVVADARAVGAAGNAEDFKRLQATLEHLGHDAAAVDAYSMPRCADPTGTGTSSSSGLRRAATMSAPEAGWACC